MPVGADFLQQQVKLAEVGLGDATRRQDWSTVLLLPALFHGTEALGQPHGALLAVGVLEQGLQFLLVVWRGGGVAGPANPGEIVA